MAATLTVNPRRLRWHSLLGASNPADGIFRAVVFVFGGLVVMALIFIIVASMVSKSTESIGTFGWSFLTGTDWDPVNKVFGALPFIYGTVASSAIALVIATPISLGVSIFVVELSPPWLGNAISVIVELLAAIPSVLLGLWAIFVMVPWLQSAVEPALMDRFGDLPLFEGPPYGVGLLAAGLVLAIMITPTIVAISRDVMVTVPISQREAMIGLGATNWEATTWAVLPYARSGILGAIVLGLGRALGETMAVTMVIGNRAELSASILHPAYTMASVLANEFSNAGYNLYVSSLVEVGLVLFGVTIIMNAAARVLVWSTARASQQIGGV